jgi:hypothetical protein
MPLLRLTQHIESSGHYRVEIAFEDDDASRQTAEARFEFAFTQEDRADLRWYLEDYLQYPLDPAPQIAGRIEGRMSELGAELFQKIFQGNDDARDLWATLRHKLDDTRIEVLTDVAGATALPWELLRDPKTDAVLALRAKDFVRSYTRPVQKAQRARTAEKVRILLVICRPGGGQDVPFRSVAGRMIKGLSEQARERFDLDVLRPPTFAQLSKTLLAAKERGEPYDIVHFDGHGAYVDAQQANLINILAGLIPHLLAGSPSRPGSHGYLLFENPELKDNTELVDGPALGKLLVEADVPVLILNACRSAHAVPLEAPDVGKEVDESHSQVRAFGSLAQEVMDAGVAGVVAMRYNVYVVTAAQFVADLYAALAAGMTLGEAASLGRKQLAAQPLRTIAFEPRPLQDWPVPVVYEAAPLRLFPPPQPGAESPRPFAGVTLDLTKSKRPQDALPRPEVGFFGRDETLLALDRAFDRHKIVLLHAYAGSGKTMTAAEFARWYAQTGGLEGPVLFTAFTEYKPLARVLDTLEETFRPLLEANNIHWLALSDAQRLDLTMQIFRQIPVLWIWDNVEPVAGFPSGAASAWTEAEQKELKYFLDNMAAMTQAKFLLTSRRDEQGWLGELPARVKLPPMPMQEMVQLARALAEKRGAKLESVEDWRPLLSFTQGNPMTLTVLVGQALRDGLKTKAQVQAYVARLRAGQAAFEDDEREGRSKSLGASLQYGFEQAFTEDERKVLALLHFFQGFVDVDALKVMVNPTSGDWGFAEFKGFTREQGIALLDRAAEIGLLEAHGGGYYSIHPALPWFFNRYYESFYGGREAQAARAFVEALGELGNYYHNTYEAGKREVIAALRAEEANLLHARGLALRQARRAAEQGQPEQGWWEAVISAMQGLDELYDHLGRRAEWRRLVEEIVPDYVGADFAGTNDGPLPGREGQWSLVTQYRVRLAMEARRWEQAERLQRVCVEWDRQNAAAALARPAGALSAAERNAIRWLAASLHELGEIQREQGKAECANSYQEAIPFLQRIGDRAAEAVAAFNLGRAYTELPDLRDLGAAEGWYRRSLALRDEGDRLGRGRCYNQLGYVAWERFQDAREAGAPEAELLEHLNAALGFYHQALALLPPDAVDSLAVTHHQLGSIYGDAGDLERALYHYNQSIHYKEMAGNIYGAGQTRFNIALALARAGRFDDALLYARAARRNFEPYGQGAAEMMQRTEGLIAWIEQAMRGGG